MKNGVASRAWPLAGALLVSACGTGGEEAADLVLAGGRVVRVDPSVPEGEAVAILHGRIASVGSADQILSRDILTVDEPEIPGTLVDMTVVGGEVVYERPGGSR